jgi:hypothetical protein
LRPKMVNMLAKMNNENKTRRKNSTAGDTIQDVENRTASKGPRDPASQTPMLGD